MVYRKSLIVVLLIGVGYLIGSMIIRPRPIEIVALLGMLFLGLSFFKIEFPFYFIVLFLILSTPEAPTGSIFEYLLDRKFSGVPTLFELAAVVLIFSFFARLLFYKEKAAFSPFKLPVIIFFALFAVSFIVGRQNGVDEIILREDFKKFLLPVLLLICSLNILSSDRRILFVVTFSFAVAVIKSSLGVIYYLKGYGFEYGDMKTVFLGKA